MRLANLSFRYTRRAPWVLHDVDLDLPAGTVAEVTGRNGAGKSTLLRLLAGTTPPSRGRISGRPPIVGYAPEIFPVEQPFTVTAYLSHMAAVRGVGSAAIDPWVERLGMTALLDVPLGDLSKGSAHKVGLAQALLIPPGLLILDEPFSGLDAQARAELPRVIEEVSASGGIVVVSDHQNGLAGHPGVLPLKVENGTVRHFDPLAGGSTPIDAPSTAVIEIVVDASDAEAIARKLQAEGYEATIRAEQRAAAHEAPLSIEPRAEGYEAAVHAERRAATADYQPVAQGETS
ncbi:ABC transporter ATP-binding protein [Sphaerisporangium perillae]|uniref:ABC transporter ATP-binding protein n=1 Tax=Sphaerisporangium perillae TaxID=2935860 RepID=UPI00200D1F5D|nr:ATP-binding cassette domain-containing protein [Sphaerisporangium perillae]